MNEARWEHVLGVITPGGDPCYRCSNCKGTFVFGIEQKIKIPPDKCPKCGIKMIKKF